MIIKNKPNNNKLKSYSQIRWKGKKKLNRNSN